MGDWAIMLEDEVARLRAEIERLRAWAKDEQHKRHKAEEDRMNARSEIERLRAARDELAYIVNYFQSGIAGGAETDCR